MLTNINYTWNGNKYGVNKVHTIKKNKKFNMCFLCKILKYFQSLLAWLTLEIIAKIDWYIYIFFYLIIVLLMLNEKKN